MDILVKNAKITTKKFVKLSVNSLKLPGTRFEMNVAS